MKAQEVKRVSVLVSTYRRHHYLRKALQSILAQSYENFDVLVWNDGGIEDMESQVPELADPRVRYHRHPENLGVLHAVQLGMRATAGEYIAHMDDDDEWDPGFLSNQVRLLDENPTAAIAFCDHWVIDDQGGIDERSTEENSRHWGRLALSGGLIEPAYSVTFNGTIPLASAAVIRRSAVDLDDFPEELHHAYDIWISYLATRGGAGVVYEPRRLVRERRHGAQIGSAVASTPMLGDLTLAYERFWAQPTFAVDRELLSRRLASASANWAVALLRDGEFQRAQTAARRSMEIRYSLRGAAALTVASLPPSLSRTLARTTSAALARWRRVTQAALVGQGSH
jgi:glycosyltransferase involved in cell wall biosynthesis